MFKKVFFWRFVRVVWDEAKSCWNTCALGNRLLVSRRVLECVIDRVGVSLHRVEVENSMYVCSVDPCVINVIDVR